MVNLGAPGQGAYGFVSDLADYRYLDYDVVILFAGDSHRGKPMTFDLTPGVVNHYLWRRQSPIYRMTGYLPVLPMVFREKAMALLAGGAARHRLPRPTMTFTPGLGTRATASALNAAAAIADALDQCWAS